MSSVDNPHPSFLERLPEWQMLRASLRGAAAIKEAGEAYLPMPDGFRASSQPDKMYGAYLMRAQYPDIIRPTIAGIIGVVHRTEANVSLPPELELLRERCTPDGLTLDAFHRLISAEVLLQGRYGVLADVPKDGGNVYLAGYAAETIRNWSEFYHDLYVLDETRLRRVGFAWMEHRRYRVLQLIDGVYQQAIFEYGPQASIATGPMTNLGIPNSGIGVGSAAVPDAQLPDLGGLTAQGRKEVEQLTDTIIPFQQGGKPLDFLPMVIIGSRDIRDIPDEAPMIGVARSALAIYRLDADYRHQMFMTGQETLVFSGVDSGWQPSVVGAGVWIALTSPEAKAYYVGVSGAGIGAIRQAITDERAVAIAEGARLFTQQNSGSRAESGEALRLRYSSESASLVDVAKASAAGLEKALRFAAQLVGADPDLCIVEPNLEFIDVRMTATDALALTQVWMQGGISYDTLYANLARGELADQDRTAQDELDLIAQERPPAPAPGVLGPDGQPIAPAPPVKGAGGPTNAPNPSDTPNV